MKKIVNLPLVEPVYSTYHNHGNSSAVLSENPSIRNWLLNEVMILTCEQKFLNGHTSPEIDIEGAAVWKNPYLERVYYPMRHLGGYAHAVIRRLIDDGYYVLYSEVDDYYMKGKTWYKERHYLHDGLICGYNQLDETYRVYAYDASWIYRAFDVPKRCFEAGRKAGVRKGVYGLLCGIKAKKDMVDIDLNEILENLQRYLNNLPGRIGKRNSDDIHGIVVHDYIITYLNLLLDGRIPYERMDWRVFRLLWEHKKIMLERIVVIEDLLGFEHEFRECYADIVKTADNMRMLYTAYYLKRRDSIIANLINKLALLKTEEEEILTRLVLKMKEVMEP
jgi:hypothetical protein